MVSREASGTLVFGSRFHGDSCCPPQPGAALGASGQSAASTPRQLRPRGLACPTAGREDVGAACLHVGGGRKEMKECPSWSPLGPPMTLLPGLNPSTLQAPCGRARCSCSACVLGANAVLDLHPLFPAQVCPPRIFGEAIREHSQSCSCWSPDQGPGPGQLFTWGLSWLPSATGEGWEQVLAP